MVLASNAIGQYSDVQPLMTGLSAIVEVKIPAFGGCCPNRRPYRALLALVGRQKIAYLPGIPETDGWDRVGSGGSSPNRLYPALPCCILLLDWNGPGASHLVGRDSGRDPYDICSNPQRSRDRLRI